MNTPEHYITFLATSPGLAAALKVAGFNFEKVVVMEQELVEKLPYLGGISGRKLQTLERTGQRKVVRWLFLCPVKDADNFRTVVEAYYDGRDPTKSGLKLNAFQVIQTFVELRKLGIALYHREVTND